jgi:hypothetical protein
LNKKDKLLFSFDTNTVKMFGFVEPAQRKRICVSASTVGFVWFGIVPAGKI